MDIVQTSNSSITFLSTLAIRSSLHIDPFLPIKTPRTTLGLVAENFSSHSILAIQDVRILDNVNESFSNQNLPNRLDRCSISRLDQAKKFSQHLGHSSALHPWSRVLETGSTTTPVLPLKPSSLLQYGYSISNSLVYCVPIGLIRISRMFTISKAPTNWSPPALRCRIEQDIFSMALLNAWVSHRRVLGVGFISTSSLAKAETWSVLEPNNLHVVSVLSHDGFPAEELLFDRSGDGTVLGSPQDDALFPRNRPDARIGAKELNLSRGSKTHRITSRPLLGTLRQAPTLIIAPRRSKFIY